jgi:zinc protease
LTRQQIADEITRLKIRGSLTHFETTREKLPEALRLVARLLQRAELPGERNSTNSSASTLTALQSQLDNPQDLSSDALQSHFNTYPAGDPRYHTPLAERIEQVQATTLDDVVRYHRDLIGTARGEIAIVGDFDEAIARELQSLFPDYVSRSPYGRVDREFAPCLPSASSSTRPRRRTRSCARAAT